MQLYFIQQALPGYITTLYSCMKSPSNTYMIHRGSVLHNNVTRATNRTAYHFSKRLNVNLRICGLVLHYNNITSYRRPVVLREGVRERNESPHTPLPPNPYIVWTFSTFVEKFPLSLQKFTISSTTFFNVFCFSSLNTQWTILRKDVLKTVKNSQIFTIWSIPFLKVV